MMKKKIKMIMKRKMRIKITQEPRKQLSELIEEKQLLNKEREKHRVLLMMKIKSRKKIKKKLMKMKKNRNLNLEEKEKLHLL